jgi:site-specific DNA-methyltransferase (adenine-specific)
VLDRIIKASSNPGDIVVDPFNGSGTTVVSAAMLDRKYLGIDQSEDYVKFAQKRLAHALEKKGANTSEDTVRYATDPNRESRVMTETDAFGRKRVARRGRAAKTA